MSRFSGPQGPGALKVYREKKRREAEERQKLVTLVGEKTSTPRRRKKRAGNPKGKAAKAHG